MQNLTAQVTSEVLQFPDATVKALQEDEIQLDSVVRARFTSGKAGLAWLACGPQLEVTNCLTGERLSAYHFSGLTERPPTVVAVREFTWQKKTGLLVGLVEAEGSVLCLYDVGISRVVKAVVLPGSVTAVEPIINHGGASASTQHLHQSLRWFFGVATVVTDIGHVLLIDLCLDDVTNSQDELDASDLEVMSGIPSEIPKLREAAAKERRHLCLQLLAPSGTAVTALCYISRTNQLAVGFSDGYLSLWNMKSLRREYHVQIEGGNVPVSAVTFQEPENDPRNCCYLWAVQATPSGGEVSLHLLQLAFGDRKCLASGHIYENLEYCEERYSLNLSTNSLRNQANSTKLLSCQTIEKFHAHSEREDGPHEVTSPDTSVTVFSWQVTTYGHGKPSVYMAVFDINRWYQAQMPDSLRPGQFLRNCSYFAFWSLESVSGITQDGIFDILVHERSFSRGAPTSFPPPEQFYYPSTYNFDATCLLISGVVHIACTGFQKGTLYHLKNFGGSLNDTVPDSYSRCLVAGLLSPRLSDIQPSNMSQEEQLQAVLSAAVETSSISLLTRCIKQWTTEEQPRSAANLRFVLEWTWDKVVKSKMEFDRLCVPLFDGTCNFIDPQTLQSLQHCQLRLANLSTVLNYFLTEAQEVTKQGFIDLTNKQSVTKLLAQYTSVVLWFCRCGLLPDYLDETIQLTRPYYNYNLMQQYYAERRKKLDNLSRGKWKTSSLMIDGMVGQLGEKVEHLWKRDEGGTGNYPPANLHALLDLYLLGDAEEIHKHAITIYFLLDIMYSFPDKPDSSIESFPTAFSVPCGLIKLIQGFWLLDHNDCQNSVDCILHPAASRVMAWQHNKIIETLMCQGDHRQALRYIQVMKPPAVSSIEVKRHITVLLANKNLIEAWNLQRLHSTRLNVEELLKHMYETCQEMGIMEDLLKLTFTDTEHEYLQRFLQTGGVQNQELLLVHHLQRANYIQALQLNQSLKGFHVSDLDRRLRERAVARNSILDQYGKILPKVQRTLASERTKPYALSSTIWKEVTRPKPLSTVAKQTFGSVLTKANFISNVLMKIKEVSFAEVQEDFSPYKSLPTEDQDLMTTSPLFDAPNAFVGTPVSKSRRISRLLDSIVHPVLAEPSLLDTDFELASEQAPSKSSVLMTSSPEKTNLLKIAQLRNLAKASEFNLLETPVVVKRAKALAANSISSVYSALTPLSILRSSAHTTPLVSPSVSPGRSITPPLRPREAKISFMEQIHNNFTKESIIPVKQNPGPSHVLKSSQDIVWTENITLSTKTPVKDLPEMDDYSPGIQDESPCKMEARGDVCNISARSDQTTLEYHDAPTPEDLEEDPMHLQSNSSSIDKQMLAIEADLVLAEEGQPENVVLDSDDKDTEDGNVLHFLVQDNDLGTLHPLTYVQEIDLPVTSDLTTAEENMQPVIVYPESVCCIRDSASVISIHVGEELVSTHSENLNEQMEMEVDGFDPKEPTMEEVEESPTLQVSSSVVKEVIKEIEVFEADPGIYHPLCQNIESKQDFNVENIEQHFEGQLSDGRKSTENELDDSECENAIAPSNFTLILEGDVGEDEAAETAPLPPTSSTDEESKTSTNVSLSLPEEPVMHKIKTIDSFTIVDGKQETQIMETLLNVPDLIKVAVEENVVDVFEDDKTNKLSADDIGETIQDDEHVKMLRHVQSSYRKSIRVKKTNSKEDVDRLIQAATPPKAGVQVKGQEASPSDKSEFDNPQTPRRSVRKATKVTECSADGTVEVENTPTPNPPTPRRGGRKSKANIDILITQVEQSTSYTVRRTRSSVPEKSLKSEGELTTLEESSSCIPSSPARTRRNKAPILDQVIEENEDVTAVPPTRVTRSSKITHREAENALNKHSETCEKEQQDTTPTRGQRGKRVVNELVKHFELNATQPSSKIDSSPPPSPPKRASVRWSLLKSGDNVLHKTGTEDTLSHDQTDTPRKRARRSTVSKTVDELTNHTGINILPEQTYNAILSETSTKRSLTARKTRKSALPSVSEESTGEKLQDLEAIDIEYVALGTDKNAKSTRITRTRSSNASLYSDASIVPFAFTTPTPRRRKNAKEQVAPPRSPEDVQPTVTSQYLFSPPSLRTRRTNRTNAPVTEDGQDSNISKQTETRVPEPLRQPRGRPPKHKNKKEEKPTDKTAWSPPPVEIQLLSPPESPAADSKSVKPSSVEKKSLRKTKRRIASKPVTRRKIR